MTPSDESLSKYSPDVVVAPCPLQGRPKVHWIEIELLDQDGSPVPYEEYTIKTPGNPPVTGLLDEQGFARIENIQDPAECEVTFPNLDRDAVRFEAELAAKGKGVG